MSDDSNSINLKVQKDEDLVSFSKQNKVRSPGRPKKIDILPEDEEARTRIKRKKETLEKSDLLNAVKNDPHSTEVGSQLIIELATEAESLKYEREVAEKKKEDTTDLSSKRITSLRALGDKWKELRSMVVDDHFDFQSQQFTRLIEFIVKKIRTAARQSNFSNEQIDILVDNFAELFDDDSGWEEEAREYIQKV